VTVKAEPRRVIDWEAIEREYRAGQLSVSEIARQHEISHTAIQKKAKANGWARNLAGRVREEVATRLVSDEVAATNEREAIDFAARRGVEVVREHRGDIQQQRSLVRTLVGQLRDESEPVALADIEEAIEEETRADSNGRRRAAMLKAISLPSRAGVMKDLAIAGKILVELERQAFSLDDPEKDKPQPGATVTIYSGVLAEADKSV